MKAGKREREIVDVEVDHDITRRPLQVGVLTGWSRNRRSLKFELSHLSSEVSLSW